MHTVDSNRFSLSFTFDSSESTRIHFHWITCENVKWSDDIIKSIDYVSSLPGNSHWTFGPFPPGLQQEFNLPLSHPIDASILQSSSFDISEDLAAAPEAGLPQIPENEFKHCNTYDDRIRNQEYPLIIVLETIGFGNINLLYLKLRRTVFRKYFG